MKDEGTYANEIQFYLKDRGKTAKAVAMELGVSLRMLSYYQHGRVAMPVEYRQRLATLLEAPVDEIFPRNVSPSRRSASPSSQAPMLTTPIAATPVQMSSPATEDIFIPDLHAFPGSEEGMKEESITYAIWFGQRVKDIEALVSIFSGKDTEQIVRYRHLQTRISNDIERWNYTTMQHDSSTHDYRVSRRTALTTLATLSTALLLRVQRKPTAAVMEEFLAQCSASVTTCRELLNGDGISTVAYAVPKYLPLLELFAQQPSVHQRTAAYLATQGYLLLATVELHRQGYQKCETYFRLAVQYSWIAQDSNLVVATLKQYAMRQLEDRHPAQALTIYQQALPVIKQAHQTGVEHIMPRLEGFIYLGIAISSVYLQKQRTKEIDAYFDQAQEAFANPMSQQLPYVSLGMHHLYLGEGLGCAELGDVTGARTMLAKVQIQGHHMGIEERIRLEIVNQQATIALMDGDLEEFMTYSILGIQGAQAIGSERRRQEVLANWKQALKTWPQEKRVLELAEVLV